MRDPPPPDVMDSTRNPRSILLGLAVGLGVLVRLVQYVHDRSLWVDEALLARAVDLAPFGQLAGGLSAKQVAPLGFLVVVKVLAALVGDGEMVLRLLPFVSGVGAVLLVYPALRPWSGRTAAGIATALFAVSGPAIYYSTEFKQYSTEILVTLAWLAALAHARNRRYAPRSAVLLALAGVAAVLFSLPAPVVLAGTALPVLWREHRSGEPAARRRLAAALVPAAALFLTLYLGAYARSVDGEFMRTYWRDSLLPFPPFTADALRTWARMPMRLMRDPVGLRLEEIAFAVFLIGIYRLLRRDASDLAVLLGPLVLATGFAAAGLYPLGGRLALYLVPLAVAVLAAGIEAAWNRRRPLGVALLAVLLFFPARNAARRLVDPREREEVRTVLAAIAQPPAAGVGIYVHWSARPAFQYYRERFALQESAVALGAYPDLPGLAVESETADPMAAFEEALAELPRESWFLFAGTWAADPIGVELLRERGQVVDSVRAVGARAYRVRLR